MIWKNIVVLAGLVWFTQSYAAHPVVGEDMDDALQHKYEAPHAQKAQKRGVAAQGKPPTSEVKEQEADVKYWRWSEQGAPQSKD